MKEKVWSDEARAAAAEVRRRPEAGGKPTKISAGEARAARAGRRTLLSSAKPSVSKPPLPPLREVQDQRLHSGLALLKPKAWSDEARAAAAEARRAGGGKLSPAAVRRVESAAKAERQRRAGLARYNRASRKPGYQAGLEMPRGESRLPEGAPRGKAWSDEARAAAAEARRAGASGKPQAAKLRQRLSRVEGQVLARRPGDPARAAERQVAAENRERGKPGFRTAYGRSGVRVGGAGSAAPRGLKREIYSPVIESGRRTIIPSGDVYGKKGAMPSQVRPVRGRTSRRGVFNAPPRKAGVEKPGSSNTPIASYDDMRRKARATKKGIIPGQLPIGPNPLGGIGLAAEIDASRGVYPFKPKPSTSYRGDLSVRPTAAEMIADKFDGLWGASNVKTKESK